MNWTSFAINYFKSIINLLSFMINFFKNTINLTSFIINFIEIINFTMFMVCLVIFVANQAKYLKKRVILQTINQVYLQVINLMKN